MYRKNATSNKEKKIKLDKIIIYKYQYNNSKLNLRL